MTGRQAVAALAPTSRALFHAILATRIERGAEMAPLVADRLRRCDEVRIIDIAAGRKRLFRRGRSARHSRLAELGRFARLMRRHEMRRGCAPRPIRRSASRRTRVIRHPADLVDGNAGLYDALIETSDLLDSSREFADPTVDHVLDHQAGA